MQLIESAVVLGLVCLNAVIAAPTATTPKLGKRSVTIERVAVGWKERDVLHSRVRAMEKFGLPIPSTLREAHVQNRAQAKVRAKHRNGHKTTSTTDPAAVARPQDKRKHGGKGKGGKGKGQGQASGNAAGATATADPAAVPAATNTSDSANGNAAQATGQTGQVVNVPKAGDVEFLAEITIGGQKIAMDFDTGSSDLWVFSTNLAAAAQQGHTVFDPAKSTTFKAADPQLQREFSIRFGDNSTASGNSPNTIGTDVVDIGGAVAQAQTIELADTVSSNFVTDTASNGLVGLAFSSLNTVAPQPAKTFFDTIADDLAQPILAANLKPGAPGSYSFGELDTTAFTGDLTEVPIDNSQGFWQFDSSTFSVGNGGQVQQNSQNSPAIADTGTTLMIVDQAIFEGYYSQVQGAQVDGQGGAVFPCSSALPDLTVAVGSNYNAVIPGKLLNFQVLDKAGTTCAGAIQSNGGGRIQIYGDIFFKAQYTVFNIKKNSISLAPHA